MDGEFSKDGKYFGQLTNEGKLKIWNVLNNTFEQEYTPDYHLKSPCTCLNFVQLAADTSKVSPKKVKQKRIESISAPHVILGTSSGLLLIYSIAKAELEFTINSATNQPITCLSWDNKKFMYSGIEENIVCWDINAKRVRNKWKSGTEKITCILLIPKNRLLTASRSIKLWDIQSQQILKSFTGHSSEVKILEYIQYQKNSDEYFISGSKGDRLLSCWVLNENNEVNNCVTSFLMEDIAFSISIALAPDGTMNVSAVTRSGVVHIYQYILNGKFSKPFKPKTTLQVASDRGQSDSIVTPIPILAALYQTDMTITICYGNNTALVFENVVINAYEKVQCLVRNDNKKGGINEKKLKTKVPITENHVQYLTPYATSAVPSTNAKRKGALEVPMEVRLDNLSLNKADQNSKVPRADNVSQLLIQGLQSKDKTILRSVLNSSRDESVIKNTIKRLPVPVIAPLIHELTSYVGGKTVVSHIGSLWLKSLLQLHAGLLVSNPELSSLLDPVLSNIECRLSLQSPLNKLKGRLDLLISQVNVDISQQDEHEPLLVYNDNDVNESDMEAIDLPEHSESDNDWMEEDSEEDKVQQNGDSESEMSVYELSD